MTQAQDWQPGTVYLRHIPKKGVAYIAEHRCWNTALFLETQERAAKDDGGRIEVVDEATYKQSKET